MKVTVFQPPDEERPPPTKSDKELYYDELSKESPLDAIHHDLFYEMEMSDTAPPESTIPSVIAHYLAKYFVPVLGSQKLYTTTITLGTPTRVAKFEKVKGKITRKMITAAKGALDISGFMVDEIGRVRDNSRPSNVEISTGSFGMQDEQGVFVGEMPGKFIFKGAPASVIFFKDKGDALSKMRLLVKHVSNMVAFFNTHYDSIHPRGIKVDPNFTPIEYEKSRHPRLEEVAGPLHGRTDLDVQQVLFSMGLPDLFHSPSFDADLENEKRKIHIKKRQEQQRIAMVDIIAVESAKALIGLEKFGKVLTQKQKKIVDAEYERMQKMSSPHAKLERVLIESFGKDVWAVKKALTAVKQAAGDANVNVACPHAIKRAEEIVKTGRMSDISEGIVREFSSHESSNGYFCKICGEKLANLDTFESVLFVNGMRVRSLRIEDELRSTIWKEVIKVVGFVRFSIMVNTKSIVASITDAIYPEISRLIADMEKIQTNSARNIEDLTQIHITVYAIAIMIRMIILDPAVSFSKRYVVSAEGGAAVSKKAASKATAVSKKAASKATAVSKKADSKKEVEKKASKATAVSKKAASKKAASKATAVSKKADSKKEVEKDASKKAASKKATNRKKGALHVLFDSGLNIINKVRRQNIDAVPGLSDVRPLLIKAFRWVLKLKTAEVSKLSGFSMEGSNTLEFVFMESLHHWFATRAGKRPERSDMKRYLGRDRATIEREAKTGTSIFSTIKPPGEVSKAAMSVFELLTAKFGSVVPLDPTISDFHAKYPKPPHLPPFISNETFGSTHQTRWMDGVTKKNVNIGKYYCADGRRHKFDIYVMTRGGKKIELTSRQIAGRPEGVVGWDVSDVKCSLCDVYMSKARPGKIYEVLEKKDRVEAFSAYYKSKCPEGGVHKMTKGTCSRCGYPTDPQRYYKKYKDAPKEMIPIPSRVRTAAKPLKFPEWKVINTNILELSKVVGVKYNVLINLGLSEGREFALLEKEAENRSNDVDEPTAVHRNWYILGYVMEMFKYYYTAKNHKLVFKLPEGISRLFDELGGEPDLPDIYDGFNDKFVFYSGDPVKCSNFMLNFISVSLLGAIKAAKTPKMKKFAVGLAKFIVGKMVESEKMVSKPDSAKLKVESSPAYEAYGPDPGAEVPPEDDEPGDDPMSMANLDLSTEDIENMEGSFEA